MLYIKNLEEISLSEKQIANVLPNIKFIEYRNLLTYTLSDLLDFFKTGCIVRLEYYDAEGNIVGGHFSAILLLGNTVCIFDSLNVINKNNIYNDQVIIDEKHYRHFYKLINELQTLGYTIDLNKYQYQAHNSNIATCGRHCALYLKMKLNTKDYHFFMLKLRNNFKTKDFDEIVTIATLLI